MCGGFTCSKNALTALNVLYIVVAFILIGVAVYGRASALVTNLPIIGGILACGVILFLISILGLIGAIKHHQVLLFFSINFLTFLQLLIIVLDKQNRKQWKLTGIKHQSFADLRALYLTYMVILFLLFLIQFSIACACLAVNPEQQEQLAEEGWNRVDIDLKAKVQRTFKCCGFGNSVSTTIADKTSPGCEDVKKIFCPLEPVLSSGEQKSCELPACMEILQSTINYAFKLCGGIGLFFSFTEVIAAFLARRYRNQLDPEEKAARAVFPRQNYLY